MDRFRLVRQWAPDPERQIEGILKLLREPLPGLPRCDHCAERLLERVAGAEVNITCAPAGALSEIEVPQLEKLAGANWSARG